jgi:pentatricopeptide repeat protein
MKLNVISSDLVTSNILINCFCQLGLNSLSFSVFANILKRGYEPNTITFNTLIKGYCLKGDIHKALQFHDKVVAQGFQLNQFHDKVLTAIGNRIGRTIKVDKNTLQQERGKYARLCVEVDLSQPLLAMFSIKDRTYKVEYEGLHLLCLGCGKFGHYVEGCPTKDINPKDTRMSAGVDTREEGKCEQQSAQEAGPWTVVSKPRRQRRAAKTGEENKGMESMGSRFAILGKNQTDKEGEELTETNKEMTPVSIDNGLHKEIVLPKGNHPRKDMNHATRRNTNNKKGNTGMQNQDNDKDVAGKNARENKLATRGTKNFKGKNNQGPKIGAENFTDWMVSATMKAMTETNGMIATSVPLEKTGGAHYEPSGVVNNMGLSETSHIEQDKLPLPNMARPPDATDTSPILSHDQNKINVEGEAFEDATDQGYESVDSGEMEIVRETPSLPQ